MLAAEFFFPAPSTLRTNLSSSFFFLPLQLLLVPETGVERKLLIVTDAPELGVRVRGVAELEGGGLLSLDVFFILSMMMTMVDGGRWMRKRKDLSLFLFRRSRVLLLPRVQRPAQQRRERERLDSTRTSAQRDPVRLSGGCI
jgi:hypothetical protein